MANNRGGLSRREYEAKKAGKPMPYALKSKVMTQDEGKKAASTSVSKSSKDIIKAQKEYIASLTPTAEEKSATDNLGKINQQAEQERAKIVDPTQNTVAAPFVQNQTSALADKTENAIIPLKYQIAALQSQREAQGNIARAKLSFAKPTKTVDPLDTKYKELRNENLQKSIDKKGKKGSTPSTPSLAKSNAEYNKIKTNDAQQGLVTLPKGQVGPPVPKVLIQQNAKKNSAADKLKAALLKR